MDSGEDSHPKTASRIGAKTITTIAAFVLAAVMLYFSLRGIEWGQVGRLLRGAKPLNVVLCCVLATIALYLRAFRWRILLTAETVIGIAIAFWATAAGYFGNNFLPARAGEFVRTFMISSRTSLSKTYVLTTAFAERAADGIALVVITGIVLLVIPGKTPWLANASKGFAVIGIAGVLFIGLLPRLENLALAILARLPISERIRDRLAHTLEHGLRGLRSFHDGKRLAGFIALTVVIWCLDATSAVIGGDALGLNMTFPMAFILIAVIGLGSALPSAPGYVGVYQFVCATVLVPFGLSKTDAIAYSFFAQALSYFVIGIWGAVGFLQYRRLHAPARQAEIAVPEVSVST